MSFKVFVPFHTKFSLPTLDTVLKALFLLGLLGVLFVGGTILYHYKLPPHSFLRDAFKAADAWQVALEKGDMRAETIRRANKKNLTPDTSVPITGQVHWNKKWAYKGYTLVTYRFSSVVHLLDMEGKIAHKWELPFDNIWPHPDHIHDRLQADIFIETAHLYPNGDLLVQYSGIGDTPYGYGIAKVDKKGKALWTYNENAHHDMHVDTDGTIYALTQTMIHREPRGLPGLHTPVLADFIVKLTSQGKEVERISLLEAFRDSEFSLMLYSDPRQHGNSVWDLFHTNSLHVLDASMAAAFPMFKPGFLLISIRGMNAIAVIDPKARKVVWAYHGSWFWPHAARFLPNGTILVLDNRGHIVDGKQYSKLIELNPASLEIEWRFPTDLNNLPLTVIYGRTQRLPNKNTLAAFAYDRRIVEITPEGKIAWSFQVSEPLAVNRVEYISNAERYAPEDLPFLEKGGE